MSPMPQPTFADRSAALGVRSQTDEITNLLKAHITMAAKGLASLPSSQREKLRRAVLSATNVEEARQRVRAVVGRPSYSRQRKSIEDALAGDNWSLDLYRLVVVAVVDEARTHATRRAGIR